MKSAVVWFGTLGAFLIAAFLLMPKYDEWFVFPAKRAYVNNNLKDPASTQYRNERMTKAGWLCGELNSKNSSGGYVGFKRYISGSADDAYLEDHGYVGVRSENEPRHAQLIEQLDAQTAVLKRVAHMRELGSTFRPSESEIIEMARKDMFEVKWKQICATN